MGSTLSTLRGLLENQLDTGTTSAATDPKASLLNQYINISIRKIARRYQPSELISSSPTSVSVTSGTNIVTIPTTLFFTTTVYVLNSSSKYVPLKHMRLKDLIEYEGSSSFFDSTNTGTPKAYATQGSSLIFNKFFLNTDSNGLKLYGVTIPTTLSDDSDECSIITDYDLGIIYESAVLYYQKDDDVANQQKYEALAKTFFDNLIPYLNPNFEEMITLDPNYFYAPTRSISSPGYMFGDG